MKLLLEKGADINSRDKFGFTVLMASILGENPEVCRIFFSRGSLKVSLGAILITSETTAINNLKYIDSQVLQRVPTRNFQISCVLLQIALYLLERGADVTVTKKDGRTALHHAASP